MTEETTTEKKTEDKFTSKTEKAPDTKKEEEKETKTEKPSMIQDAENAAERLEKANAEKKELLDREEKILAERKLGGKSNYGETEKKKDPLDDPVEYAKAIERGEVNPLEDKSKDS